MLPSRIMKNITLEQMELTMNKDKSGLRSARADRRPRARWWFNRMRQVVDLGLPVQPLVSPRPEQTYLGLRQTSLL
jgi:hypothetical protein